MPRIARLTLERRPLPSVAAGRRSVTGKSVRTLPLNVLARPGLPPASNLEALGVRRLSAGSGVTQAVYGRISSLVSSFLDDGASAPLADGAMVYAHINTLFDAL